MGRQSLTSRSLALVVCALVACDPAEEDPTDAPADTTTADGSTGGPRDPGSTGSDGSTSGSTTAAESSSSTAAADSSSGDESSEGDDGSSGSSTGDSNVCGPPTPSQAGTVTLDGATFDAVDAVAIVTELEDVATENGMNPFRTELRIRLSANPDACSRENEAIFRLGETLFQLLVIRNSDTDFPGLPEPGTYPVDTVLPMANDGTTYFRVAGELFDCNEMCELCGSIIESPTGSLTITEATETSIAGTFEYSDNTGTYTGSFDTPICGSTEPDPDSCCWSP